MEIQQALIKVMQPKRAVGTVSLPTEVWKAAGKEKGYHVA